MFGQYFNAAVDQVLDHFSRERPAFSEQLEDKKVPFFYGEVLIMLQSNYEIYFETSVDGNNLNLPKYLNQIKDKIIESVNQLCIAQIKDWGSIADEDVMDRPRLSP